MLFGVVRGAKCVARLYKEEGLGEGGEGCESLPHSVNVGLAIGLPIGGALLIVIIAIIAVVVRECRRKPREKEKQLEMNNTAELRTGPRAVVHYPQKRDTLYWNTNDPYGVMDSTPPPEENQSDLSCKTAETFA